MTDTKLSYFYKILFEDGRTIYRKNVTKQVARSMGLSMEHEMLLFKVKRVEWGIMQ